MNIVVIGGTGFIGRHLTERLLQNGHRVTVVARSLTPIDSALSEHSMVNFVEASINDTLALTSALKGCDAVYNCVGIVGEKKSQLFDDLYVNGTRSLVSATKQARIKRLIHLGFLRSRIDTASPFHTTNSHAEEIVRTSGLNYTIVAPGIVYGSGGHFLKTLVRVLTTLPFFPLIGKDEKNLSPIHIDDLTRLLTLCLERPETSHKTYSVVGPEKLSLGEIVDVVADKLGLIPHKARLPIALHNLAAMAMEKFMTDPFLTVAQVLVLSDDLTGPYKDSDALPEDLQAKEPFSVDRQTLMASLDP